MLAGTWLGFDFGEQRIGVAVGNTVLKQANPLITIGSEKNELRFAKIAELIKEWQPTGLVVGLPAYDDDRAHPLAPLCRRFANRLNGRYSLPTYLVNESYTSCSASAVLSERGVHGRKQKDKLDQYAAQLILQAYFDEPNMVISAGRVLD